FGQDVAGVVEAVEGSSQSVGVLGEMVGCPQVDGTVDDLGHLQQSQMEVAFRPHRGRDERTAFELPFVRLAEQGADAYRRVLQIRPGLALEGREAIEVERSEERRV